MFNFNFLLELSPLKILASSVSLQFHTIYDKMKRRRNHHKLICLARLDATCNFIKCITHWVLLLTWATTVFANHVHNVKSNNRSLPITSMATVTSLLLSTDNVATTLHPSLADHRHHFSSTTPSSLSIVNLSSGKRNRM